MTLARWVKILASGRPFYYLADLMKLSGLDYQAARKAAQRLEKNGILVRVARELMVNQLVPPRLEVIACTIRRPAYVSLESALHIHGALDQAPAAVTCITAGRPGIVNLPVGTITYHRLAPRLFFGFEAREGFNLASPEKALLDFCYLKSRGVSLALPGDVDPEAFDPAVLSVLAPRFPSTVLKQAMQLLDNPQ